MPTGETVHPGRKWQMSVTHLADTKGWELCIRAGKKKRPLGSGRIMTIHHSMKEEKNCSYPDYWCNHHAILVEIEPARLS